MAKQTLASRYEALSRPVSVRVRLPLAAVLRLEGVARQRGLSRGQAIAEAVRDWGLRGERSLDRARKIELAHWLDEAMVGQEPEILAESEGIQPKGRDSDRGVVYKTDMSTLALAERRQALGLSQQRLAELAGCSMGTVRLLEGGYTPKESEKAKLIERALADAERAAA